MHHCRKANTTLRRSLAVLGTAAILAGCASRAKHAKPVPDPPMLLPDFPTSTSSSESTEAKPKDLGKERVPHLISIVETGNDEDRCKAISRLGELGDISAVPVLIRTLDDRDHIAKCAVEALKKLCDPSTYPALVRATRSGDWMARARAVNVIGGLGDAALVPPLIKVLEYDSSVYVSTEAAKALGDIAKALGDIGDKSAVPALIKSLQVRVERSFGGIGEVIVALGKLKDPSATPAILEAIQGGRKYDWNIDDITDALAAMGEPAVPLLKDALKDKDNLRRAYAVVALGKMVEAKSVPELIERLRDADGFVREKAAWALGVLGDKAVLSELVSVAAFDPVESVRREAERAIRKISDPFNSVGW